LNNLKKDIESEKGQFESLEANKHDVQDTNIKLDQKNIRFRTTRK